MLNISCTNIHIFQAEQEMLNKRFFKKRLTTHQNAILCTSERGLSKPSIANRNLKFYPLNYKGYCLNLSELNSFYLSHPLAFCKTSVKHRVVSGMVKRADSTAKIHIFCNIHGTPFELRSIRVQIVLDILSFYQGTTLSGDTAGALLFSHSSTKVVDGS